MTKDTIASIFASLFFAVLVPIIGGEWFYGVFSDNPMAMSVVIISAFAFGYFIHGAVHYKDAKLKEENDELRRELGVLRAESEWYKSKLTANGTIIEPNDDEPSLFEQTDRLDELEYQLEERTKLRLREQGKMPPPEIRIR